MTVTPSHKGTKTPLTVRSRTICWLWISGRTHLNVALDVGLLDAPLPVCLRRRDTSVNTGEERRGVQRRREEKSSSVYLQQNHQESLKVAAGVATDVLLQVVVVLWETHGARASVHWLLLREHQCDEHRDLRESQTQEVTMNCIVIVTPVIWLFLVVHMPCNNIRLPCNDNWIFTSLVCPFITGQNKLVMIQLSPENWIITSLVCLCGSLICWRIHQSISQSTFICTALNHIQRPLKVICTIRGKPTDQL